MPPSLFLLFNHTFTPVQEEAAVAQLGVGAIVALPAALQALWSQVPPELPELRPYLQPLCQWLAQHAQPGDYVLIQGDFGATYLLVNFALAQRLKPVYATTVRQASEETLADGTVRMVHHFQHRLFRRYGV
ncbi:MAG: CRISPR-associated protein Csx20 [Desulfobacca sp.]|uniref:CRISPR-associated protein Csx20 n=1 Tax=Desulfobacca sp. TaxID=2067990 RepID=UPI00404A1D4E